MNDNQVELFVLIDEFIKDISGQNIVATSLVVDRLLDIRNNIELTIAPV
jgi:hypothetical protein